MPKVWVLMLRVTFTAVLFAGRCLRSIFQRKQGADLRPLPPGEGAAKLRVRDLESGILLSTNPTQQ